MKEKFKKYKINITLFGLAFILFIFSLITNYGIWNKMIPLIVFLLLIGIGCSISDDYKFLTRFKRIYRIIFMCFNLFCEYSLVNYSLKGHFVVTGMAFSTMLLLIFILFFIQLCNIITAMVYKISDGIEINIFRKNIIYYIFNTIYYLITIFFLLLVFIN